MAGLTNTGKATMLDAFGAAVAFASLHTADPATMGVAEVVGGLYVRQPLTWSAAAAGQKASSGQPAFAVPASTTITHLGYWSAQTGGTFYGSRPLDAPQAYSTPGTYTLTSLVESIA